MAPAPPACQPSERFWSRQNSHMLSVAGCRTIMWASLPAAGVAPAGIGTALSALCS